MRSSGGHASTIGLAHDRQKLEVNGRSDTREIHAGLSPVTTIERHMLGRVQNHSPELYRVHARELPGIRSGRRADRFDRTCASDSSFAALLHLSCHRRWTACQRGKRFGKTAHSGDFRDVQSRRPV